MNGCMRCAGSSPRIAWASGAHTHVDYSGNLGEVELGRLHNVKLRYSIWYSGQRDRINRVRTLIVRPLTEISTKLSLSCGQRSA
jgi:hypothetical protein